MTSSETPSPVAVLASRERLPPFLLSPSISRRGRWDPENICSPRSPWTPSSSRSELTKDSKIVLPRFKWQRLWMILPPHAVVDANYWLPYYALLVPTKNVWLISEEQKAGVMSVELKFIAMVGSTSRQSTQASMGFIAIVYSRQYRFLASTTPSNIYSKNI
ncbi:hypothetical protein MUK42_06079 [Musa troglodytarum]|uniref:Uncharacterized protein n=1 Tax=Musa troglodytarum TaxID=320322 RepID=A0A9E7HJ99_9LILI|nr:hypothetical protein MUK42_06079 [Musa troglodytarum]